jgi:hypothetical protein
VELAGLRYCLGTLARPAPVASVAVSAEARKAVGEFAIGTMLLNGGKGQIYGVDAVFLLDGHGRLVNVDDGGVPKEAKGADSDPDRVVHLKL